MCIIFFVQRAVYACSCIAPPAPNIEYSNRFAVFIGTVKHIQPDSSSAIGNLKITFTVERSWKGVSSNEVSVFTASSSAACGYYFQTDSTYLVYADTFSAKLNTGLCTRTKKFNDASVDLSFLNTLSVKHIVSDGMAISDYEITSYPNPANPTIVVRFLLPVSISVKLSLYSVTGQEVENIYEGLCNKGVHEISWNSSSVASGFYFVGLKSSYGFITTKISVIK